MKRLILLILMYKTLLVSSLSKRPAPFSKFASIILVIASLLLSTANVSAESSINNSELGLAQRSMIESGIVAPEVLTTPGLAQTILREKLRADRIHSQKQSKSLMEELLSPDILLPMLAGKSFGVSGNYGALYRQGLLSSAFDGLPDNALNNMFWRYQHTFLKTTSDCPQDSECIENKYKALLKDYQSIYRKELLENTYGFRRFVDSEIENELNGWRISEHMEYYDLKEGLKPGYLKLAAAFYERGQAQIDGETYIIDFDEDRLGGGLFMSNIASFLRTTPKIVELSAKHPDFIMYAPPKLINYSTNELLGEELEITEYYCIGGFWIQAGKTHHIQELGCSKLFNEEHNQQMNFVN